MDRARPGQPARKRSQQDEFRRGSYRTSLDVFGRTGEGQYPQRYPPAHGERLGVETSTTSPLQLVAGCDPGIDAAEEWAYAGVAQIHQRFGRGRGARLVGAVAEEHDVVIERQAVTAIAHLIEGHDDGARDRPAFLPGDSRAQIDDYRLARPAHEAAQLLDSDARDAQRLI
jgi:hypothetical protein